MNKYKYSCSSLGYLLMESGIISIEEEGFIVVLPEQGDLAEVNGIEYIFQNGTWKIHNKNNSDY